MEFLHYAFLAGAATFTVPVIIHLMFRLRKKRIVFSSLRFIQQTMLRQSQRLRLRELILLLLRCAACILIALSFARPFRPDSALAGAGGKPQEDVVLVLDDSPSLGAQETARPRWLSLLEKARAEVLRHPVGDRIALVLASAPTHPEIELSSNFGVLSTALQREKPSSRRGDLALALNCGIELLALSTQTVRRVIVYSDLQTNQVMRGEWALAAERAAATGRGIVVQIETPSGSQPANLPNLAVTDVHAKSDVWIEGRAVPFSVRISNNSDAENPDIPVKLIIGGKTVASRSVGLAPRSSTEIEISAPFPSSGEVIGQVEIEAHDAFPDDDVRRFALHLRNSLKVLVVEERLGEKNSFLDEGYYLRMALDPKARGGDLDSAVAAGGTQNYVQVQSIVVARASADVYRNTDLIVLAGIVALKDDELSLLENAVAGGRHLILFVGDAAGHLSEPFYNGAFWKNGHGLLPARPGPLYEGNRLEGKYHTLGEFKTEHTLFKPFAGENEPHLRLPRYVRHFQANPLDLAVGSICENIEAPPGEGTKPVSAAKEVLHPPGTVLATFSDGSPLVMERAYGKGSVLMFNFAPRPESTDLPKRKVFVPLLHQAVRHFAGVSEASRRNLVVGDPFDFGDAGATLESSVLLEKPNPGSPSEGSQDRKEVLSLTGRDHPEADTAGIYHVSFNKGTMKERTVWAVNLDPRESELISENLASLRETFASNTMDASLGASGVRTAWDDERKSQAPDWRYFLVAALACLLLEVVLRDFWI